MRSLPMGLHCRRLPGGARLRDGGWVRWPGEEVPVSMAGEGGVAEGDRSSAVAAGARPLDRRMLTIWTVEEGAWSAVLVVLLGALTTWKVPSARFRNWSYEVAEEALELRHGVIERVHSAIPYYRVQYVDINQGPIERMVGLARLRVHTAAASSDATIPGIASGEADALRQVILERAGSGDAV